MSPLGHLSTSYLAGKCCRAVSLPAVVVGGVLPDVDFALLLAPGFNELHRVVTHNLLFVGIAVLLGAALAPSPRRGAVAGGLLLGGLLHLLVDSMLDDNATNGIGVALWWPLDGSCYSPVNLLDPQTADAGWNRPLEKIARCWPLLFVEAPCWLTAAFMLDRSRRKAGAETQAAQSGEA